MIVGLCDVSSTTCHPSLRISIPVPTSLVEYRMDPLPLRIIIVLTPPAIEFRISNNNYFRPFAIQFFEFPGEFPGVSM